jgi:signal peptidase I
MKNKNKVHKNKFDFLKWFDPFTYVDLLLEKTIGKQEGIWKNIVYWGCYILTAFICAALLYKIFGLIFGVAEPMSIVVSSSMVPNLHIGDVIIFTKPNNLKVPEITLDKNIRYKDLKEFMDLNYSINEYGLEEIESITINGKTFYLKDAITNKNSVVVYKSNINGKDIIHRAILKINAKDGTYIITKGDNHKTNLYIDQDCDIIREGGEIIAQKNCLNLYPIRIEDIQRKKIGKIPYIGYIKLVLFQ